MISFKNDCKETAFLFDYDKKLSSDAVFYFLYLVCVPWQISKNIDISEKEAGFRAAKAAFRKFEAPFQKSETAFLFCLS